MNRNSSLSARGRPNLPDAQRRKVRSVTLPQDEYEFLVQYGEGNASQGVSRALKVCRALRASAAQQGEK